MNKKEQLINLLLGELEAEYSANLSTHEQSEDRLLEFTDKEINKMPKNFRKTIRLQGKTVHYRKRTDGRYNCSYEVRYAKKPYNNPPISVSATTLEELKVKFIEKLKNYIPQEDNAPAVPKDFHGFAMYWFENFHKAKVVIGTYKNNLSLYHRHIEAKLKGNLLKDITPNMLKELLNSLPGNGKTKDDVHSILNQILSLAEKNKLISVNPLSIVFHVAHEKDEGVELTREEEIYLMEKVKGMACEIPIALMLYAGLRPNEISKCKIKNGFIVAVNSKRKGGVIEYKKIPIISHLRNHLNGTNELNIVSPRYSRKVFTNLFPDHTLKDLRKTFNTRCVECKVDFIAKEMYMGHSLGKLQKTYTGNIDNLLLSEAQKLEQWYTLYPKITPNN